MFILLSSTKYLIIVSEEKQLKFPADKIYPENSNTLIHQWGMERNRRGDKNILIIHEITVIFCKT
jgi:hypothetical protein